MTRIVLLALFLSASNLPTSAERASGATFALRGLQSASDPAAPTTSQPSVAKRRKDDGKHEIKIARDFEAASAIAENDADEPRIALLHAGFSFKTNNENWLRAELTFTNAGTTRMSEARSIYLAIDDDSGHNFVRRVLPSVDFRSLAPGEQRLFSERLLIPALQSGHYKIELWIPSSDPALKFNLAYNFLLVNPTVGDPKTGLNTLAAFEVVR
jgi:hypothetical protein